MQCDSCNRILYFVAASPPPRRQTPSPPAGLVTLPFDRLPFDAAAGSIVAYIDGGARGNPGPAGFGVRIEQADGTLVEEFSESIGVATNNVAEYRGAARGARVGATPRASRSCTCDRIRCCWCSRCSATTR